MKRHFGTLLVLTLLACSGKRNEGEEKVLYNEIEKDSSFSGSCPYLFVDKNNGILMSWVRENPDSTRVLVYAATRRDGEFGEAILVPGSEIVKPHGENAPKVVRRPDGLILAAWGVSNPNPKNPYSGLVYYTSSSDEGATWTRPRTLSQDTASIDQRYFDLEILPDGTVGVVWLDSRKKTSLEGSTLYFSKLGHDGIFTGEKVVATTTCQCCRTDLLVDEKGALHISYRQIIDSNIRDIVYAISEDNGKTFSESVRISKDDWAISGCPHTGPAMAKTPSGLAFVWYTMGTGKGVYFTSTPDKGKHFTDKSLVGDNASATHPQVEKLSNDNLLIVWDERRDSGSGIGVEIRSKDGKKISSESLPSGLAFANYPTVKSVGEELFIAYSGRRLKNDPERVYFQKLKTTDF